MSKESLAIAIAELLVNAPDELITITPPPGFEIEWVKIWILVDDYENEAGEEK